MTQKITAPQKRAGAFDSVDAADQAIRRLLSAGFSKDQLAVICPAKFQEHFHTKTPQADTPHVSSGQAIAAGGAAGATLGGIALAATALTGGAAGIVAAALVGGGAIVGGLGNLIVAKGYEEEADDYFKQAVRRGQIVVGVEVPGENAAAQLRQAERILNEAGAQPLTPM